VFLVCSRIISYPKKHGRAKEKEEMNKHQLGKGRRGGTNIKMAKKGGRRNDETENRGKKGNKK
jgi:hypothetical protein